MTIKLRRTTVGFYVAGLPKNKSSRLGYYKEQISQTKGVDKVGYMLKYTGEKFNIDEQTLVEKATPALQTLAADLVGPFNDAKLLITGKDIFENKADASDKICVVLNIAAKGQSHEVEYIEKKVLSGAKKL